MNRLALVLAILLGAAAAGAAELPRLGPEFQINSTTQGRQNAPAVAGDGFGNFIVIWTGEIAGGLNQVYGQRFDVSGARLGGEFQISSGPDETSLPQVASTPDGGFAAVWVGQGVRLRLFGPSGVAKTAEIQVSNPGFLSLAADVAVNSAGEIMVLWTSDGLDERVFTRRYNPLGQPLEEPFTILSNRDFTYASVSLAAAPDGDFLAVWSEGSDHFTLDLWMRRFDAGSKSWGDPLRTSSPSDRLYNYDPQPVFRADGSFFVVWTKLPIVFYPSYAYPEVFARSFDAGGSPLGEEVEIFGRNYSPAAAALDRDGNALVVADEELKSVAGALFDRSWHPLTPWVQLHDDQQNDKRQPAVAADGTGNFFVAWTSGLPYLQAPKPAGSDGYLWGVFGQRLGDPHCAPGAEVLCLGPAGRFEARVSWRNPFTGETGIGRSHPITADTGAFWFFGPKNLEVMIKTLDARAVNGHFWIYFGSLSNVEYTITVTDTATGKENTYHNAPFQFASRADVTAFADSAPVSSAAVAMNGPALMPWQPTSKATSGCVASAESLCLAAGRFQVQFDFTDPRTGNPARGRVVSLTEDTGIAWFFAPQNLEVMIKILDGRAVNGHFWILYGALSDVEYTITVTDTVTGEQRTYVNPRGQLASRADVGAFPVGAGK
jgi:hypothetical protein